MLDFFRNWAVQKSDEQSFSQPGWLFSGAKGRNKVMVEQPTTMSPQNQLM